jgi:hypothetical protein
MPVLEGCNNAHARTRGEKGEIIWEIFIYVYCFPTPTCMTEFYFNTNPGMLM